MTQIDERPPLLTRLHTEPEIALSAAINRALHDAMAADERVLVFGEDVARLGEIAHAHRTSRRMIQDVEQPHVGEGQFVRVGEPAVHRGVQPQGGVEEVLPGALFGDVQTRHAACGPPRDHPLHGSRS